MRLCLDTAYSATSEDWKPVANNFHNDFSNDISTIGGMGIFLIFIRAYSLGGGTYTGIEAVSNGLQIMREPKVQTGKRTMLYMATSLALTAGGLLLCYLLLDVARLQEERSTRFLQTAYLENGISGHG